MRRLKGWIATTPTTAPGVSGSGWSPSAGASHNTRRRGGAPGAAWAWAAVKATSEISPKAPSHLLSWRAPEVE